MQLVRSRPIPGPVERNGGWFDDFAKTGARHPDYVGGGAATLLRTANGIALEAPGNASFLSLTLPARHAALYADFEAEFVSRGYGTVGTSTEHSLQFRHADGNNRLHLIRDGNNRLRLFRILSGAYTSLITVNAVPYTAWHRVGLRVIGSQYELFLDGRLVGSAVDSAHLRVGGARLLSTYDPTNGTAKTEWQYLAVRPIE